MIREESEFAKSVWESGGGVIGLVNNTAWCITFTSVRLLMERSQVFESVCTSMLIYLSAPYINYLTQKMVYDCTGG